VYIFVILFCLVSEIEEPPTNFDGQVDVEAFWNSLRLEIIARGLVQSKFVFIYLFYSFGSRYYRHRCLSYLTSNNILIFATKMSQGLTGLE